MENTKPENKKDLTVYQILKPIEKDSLDSIKAVHESFQRMRTMSLIPDNPDNMQTIAKLHMSLDTATHEEAEKWVENRLKADSQAPSGATITSGTGMWFPEDHDDEVEDNIMISCWIDTEEELDAMRNMKDAMEDEFNQHCVCLSLEERYFEH